MEKSPPKTPAPPADASKESIPVVSPDVSGLTIRRFRVLVVDDSEALAKTVGWMIEILGHEVRLAHNGQNALEVAYEYRPEIIIMDIGLPDMNGFEVCRKMRADSAFQNTILIAQTGWGQREHKEQSKEAGFNYHLVKPVEVEQLEQLFRSLGEQLSPA